MVDSAPKNPPTVFLSYSWDSELHKTWVRELAARLSADGVKPILDQWELEPGSDLPLFMEQSIQDSDFVLIVCTPRYKERSDKRRGGVGFEESILTSQALFGIAPDKFVPILRGEDPPKAMPIWLLSKVHVDLRGDPYKQKEYDSLLDKIHRTGPKPPPVKPRRPRTPPTGQPRLTREADTRASVPTPAHGQSEFVPWKPLEESKLKPWNPTPAHGQPTFVPWKPPEKI
jgi:hypothetical protein